MLSVKLAYPCTVFCIIPDRSSCQSTYGTGTNINALLRALSDSHLERATQCIYRNDGNRNFSCPQIAYDGTLAGTMDNEGHGNQFNLRYGADLGKAVVVAGGTNPASGGGYSDRQTLSRFEVRRNTRLVETALNNTRRWPSPAVAHQRHGCYTLPICGRRYPRPKTAVAVRVCIGCIQTRTERRRQQVELVAPEHNSCCKRFALTCCTVLLQRYLS